HIHNAWLADLAFVLQTLMSLWVLSDLGPNPFPVSILALVGVMILATAGWDATSVGLKAKWTTGMAMASLVLLGLSIWRLKGFLQPKGETLYQEPAFWLLGTWTLDHGTLLIFYPLADAFIRHLSPAWVQIPWLVNYLVGLLLNITLARTFLCRKTNSY
ncbi:MAG TPA: hypothetical protein VFV26_00650, partial [Geothrix sp.]|nr:hypothetical protein [Geothrix sp.]